MAKILLIIVAIVIIKKIYDEYEPRGLSKERKEQIKQSVKQMAEMKRNAQAYFDKHGQLPDWWLYRFGNTPPSQF